MRIIGGLLKGKAVIPPVNYNARPTTDFAKEGLFNTLINEFDFSEIKVLDLFSGTGSISYEFASRGCPEIVAVEMNPTNAAFIKRTISAFNIKGMKIVRHNVFDFIGICKINFDIIFADPPYNMEGLNIIPDKILSSNLIRDNGYFIIEHPDSYSFINHANFFKEKKYGNVHFSYFKKI
ncbi:MAG: RsmD family RNA methyltransferase [Bacteroidales bacterium]|jgi:16S rRNA (guanine(966)-N(2))-methyltransferase RsmD